jgi:sterol desaturase/sphingolipid hydroxylase (fatty acid hydroxylase superfamily)
MTQEEAWREVRAQLAAALGERMTALDSVLAPPVVAATLALCFVLWLVRRPGAGFLAWVFPARIYARRGFLLDVQIYLTNLLLGGLVIINSTMVTTAAAGSIGGWLAVAPPGPEARNPLLVAVLVFLVADLVGFLHHRLYHRVHTLWPIHALHHSAEELNPISAFRHHPVFSMLELVIVALVIGTLQGLLLTLLTGSLDMLTLAGTNLFYALFRLAGANLRHSHIWLRYPVWLEHLLISPAQHQVHHSIDPRHRDKNFGEILAIWDWMTGSLYVPRAEETGVTFGLADAEGRRLPQPFPNYRRALVDPLRAVWARLRGRDGPAM